MIRVRMGRIKNYAIAFALVATIWMPIKMVGDYARVTSQIKLEERLHGRESACEYAKSWKKTIDTTFGNIFFYGEHKALDNYLETK